MKTRQTGRHRQQRGQRRVGERDAHDRDGHASERRPGEEARLADAVHDRHAANRVLTGDDLRLEGGEGRALEAGRHADREDHREDAEERRRPRGEHGQRDGGEGGHGARGDDDRPPVQTICDVAAIQRQCQRRDPLHQPQPAERERIMRQVVHLERDDRRERAERQPRDPHRGGERAELAEPQQRAGAPRRGCVVGRHRPHHRRPGPSSA